jgi:hypothetical protein
MSDQNGHRTSNNSHNYSHSNSNHSGGHFSHRSGRPGDRSRQSNHFNHSDHSRHSFNGRQSGGFHSHNGHNTHSGERHEGYFDRQRSDNPFSYGPRSRRGSSEDGRHFEHRDSDRRDSGRRDSGRHFNHSNSSSRFHRDGGFHRGGQSHDFHRGGGFHREGEENFHSQGHGNPRYRHDDQSHDFHQNSRSGSFHREGGFHRGGGYHSDRDRQRKFGRPEVYSVHTDARSGSRFSHGPVRNEDGSVSYPSQNPYTARRPGEPKMPKGLTWSMLSSDDKRRLRGLSKEHAENIGLHILAAYQLEETDPQAALDHAKWAAHQASRVDIARECLAFVAYRQGDYQLAEREFKTAYRMNGQKDYLPFIADCERGQGHPQKAIELALSDDCKDLEGETKFEMMLVFAGAYADQGDYDQALKIVRTLRKVRNLPGEYRMRAIQAEQNFLDAAGQEAASQALDAQAESLEDQFAIREDDNPEDDLHDTDLEDLSEADDSNLAAIGLTFHQLADEQRDAREQEEREEREAEEHDSDEEDSESHNGEIAIHGDEEHPAEESHD